jgi:glycosyltransferase involved in cell wall biosynthesis
MKIGIDITSLLYDRGVSRYTSNLVSGLVDAGETVFGFGTTLRQKQKLLSIAKNSNLSSSKVFINKMPLSVQTLAWKFHQMPVTGFLPKIDVFHSWDWLQPPDQHLPLVSTIHDLAILKYPETAHPAVLNNHKKSWEVLKKRNAHIIAVSHSTKKDIVELLQIPSKLITVIHEAIPRETLNSALSLNDTSEYLLSTKLSLNKPYLLAVGTREPRKNLMRLIQAWEPFSKDYQLIVAGESGWDQTSSNTSQAKLLINPNLRFLGKVSDAELCVLYSKAELLAYPSLDEGFGLPILEAFHFGTPVVTSDRSSMPEVAGNAAQLVNPDSVESIRAGIETILNENHNEQQKRLQRMVIRLQMFSWKQVALQTKKVYQVAVEGFSI